MWKATAFHAIIPIMNEKHTPEIMRIARILQKCGYMSDNAINKHMPLYSYGISQKEIMLKIWEQKGMCDDCGKDLENVKRWCVDHNHETGKVRGIICQSCNTAIRSLEKMKYHITYLRKYGEDI